MELTHSADGEYSSNPQIYITDNGGRVFVQRGGLWTDCVDISENPPVMCSETPLKRLVAEAWKRRSRQIERMVKAAAIRP
jgi:hypothetical protein